MIGKRFCNSVFTLFCLCFLCSCSGKVVTKTYEGKPYKTSEVAFVECSFGTTICAVNGKEFSTPLPGIRICHQLLELGPADTYYLEVWNGVVSSRRSVNRKSYNRVLKVKAEAGKVYKVYNKNRSYLRKWWNPGYREITDQEKLDTFFASFENGKFKRDQSQSLL